MYQLKSLEDTIVAISTPTGHGGIGIVRLSGDRAIAIADKIFATPKGKVPSSFKNYKANFGWIYKDRDKMSTRDVIDEALVTVMRAPKSYTTEDVVEINCHGGGTPLKAIVNLAIHCGARLAEPGEFTKRAFLNGRIDLAQAEAVLDIIQSKTEAFLKVSHNQLKGELSRMLEEIREDLLTIYTQIEALINFPDEDMDEQGKGRLSSGITAAEKSVKKLLKNSEHGRILREGIRVVLCGKPNVGKSSLLNVLLKQPRAIVTEIAGTTRDTIEETAQIRGIPLQLIDTAGVLKPRNPIEKEAVHRSHIYMDQADLILLMLDNNSQLSSQDQALINRVKDKNVIVVINKSDLPACLSKTEVKKYFSWQKIVKISALKRTGITNLERQIVDLIWHGKIVNTQGILVNNIRHIQALEAALRSLQNARSNLSHDLSPEFISQDIKDAVNALDSITGRNIDHDLLDQIFSQFCIGK